MTTNIEEPLQLVLDRDFRRDEPVHAAAIVIDDDDAKRVLAAWTTMPPPTWRRSRRPRPEHIAARWDWLWSSLRVDFASLAMRCGMAEPTVAAKFEMLRAARLVYPDGTISRPAKLVLEAYVQEHLPKPRRQPVAVTKTPNEEK